MTTLIDWIEISEHRLPPIGTRVLLRRKVTNYGDGQVTYFAAYRVNLLAPDFRILGWKWAPGKITKEHISHFAYITEPVEK